MGAETFCHVAHGKTAAEAFDNAVKEARYDHGHAGYSGTIAEKGSFILLPKPTDLIGAYVGYSEEDPDWQKVDDKWGPAGCYDLGDGKFVFFGWASS